MIKATQAKNTSYKRVNGLVFNEEGEAYLPDHFIKKAKILETFYGMTLSTVLDKDAPKDVEVPVDPSNPIVPERSVPLGEFDESDESDESDEFDEFDEPDEDEG